MSQKKLDLLSSRELMIYIQECAEKGLDNEMMRAHNVLLIREGEEPADYNIGEDVTDSSNKSNLSKTYLKIGLMLILSIIISIFGDMHLGRRVSIARILIWVLPPLIIICYLVRNEVWFRKITKRNKEK